MVLWVFLVCEGFCFWCGVGGFGWCLFVSFGLGDLCWCVWVGGRC